MNDIELEKYAESIGYHALKDREDGHSYVVLWEYPDGTFHKELPKKLVNSLFTSKK